MLWPGNACRSRYVSCILWVLVQQFLFCVPNRQKTNTFLKNQKIIDLCRILLTFTSYDAICHHTFSCHSLVVCVDCILNLMIYKRNLTFLDKKVFTFFIQNHAFFHITESVKRLLSLYNKYYEKKQGHIATIRRYYKIINVVLLSFEIRCQMDLNG